MNLAVTRAESYGVRLLLFTIDDELGIQRLTGRFLAMYLFSYFYKTQRSALAWLVLLLHEV